MMPWFLQLLDAAIVVAALVSAWLWWRASAQRMRRVSRHEELNAADLNRMVTVLNRMQIFGARAALATAVAAALAGLRLILAG
jgi:membrane protein implicated in regulation of membrane protease activity